MKTLKDYLDFDLKILSIGLNPSTISVERGYYFANPRNRFWKALNASGLLQEEFIPSMQAQEKIFTDYKIGFTDVVKRHSSMGKDLRAVDYKKWAPILKAEIVKYQPKICWFHGKIAMQNYLKYTGSKNKNIDWGLQDFKINTSTIFVTPNPSPANAAFSLEMITDWYRKLNVLVE
ncbi:MAG: mismatch-specific DNA-glycosylase [Gammaproteobacteria bacterium]|nr:mismatch-specific DNA-glycosylase [Gammaproteobacteria bacterium]MBT8124252.1 mismatch-specific DNA-glycosylase [Gammaproteobacteria bacterium]NNC67943.1 mismatch-specific DNA-glycosylase [Gammaproteobacteria bacterium]